MKRTAILGILAALAVAGSVFSASCGGGSSVVPIGRTANFAPAQSPAPPNSVSMQKGTVNGDVFQIEIRVTDVVDFFGAAFHVAYTPGTAQFVSMGSTGTVLAGQTVDIRATLLQAGDLEIVATRIQNQAGNVPGVTGSGLLLTLTFQATAMISAPGNAFSFTDEEACNSLPDPPPGDGCTQIAVTWPGGTLTAN